MNKDETEQSVRESAGRQLDMTYAKASEIVFLLDYKNARIAELEAQLAAAEREAWNAAIDAAIEKMKTFGKPYWTREETIELLEGITQ